MFIKVTRSAAITALLSGQTVFCGAFDNRSLAFGIKLDYPQRYSRRHAARVLTQFFYNADFCPKHAKIGYWIVQ